MKDKNTATENTTAEDAAAENAIEAAPPTVEELQATIANQEEVIEGQAAKIVELEGVIAEQNKTGKPVSTEPTEFKLGGKTYEFPSPKFRIPGMGVMTASEALKNKEALKKLVEIKAGNID